MSALAERIAAAGAGAVTDVRENGPRRLVAKLDAARVAETLVALRERAGCWHLSALQGCDVAAADRIDVCYHLGAEDGYVVTLVAAIPRTAPRIASVASVVPAAALYEREASEMLGIAFVGGADPGARLLLHERWPRGEHPLRKDWKPATATATATEGGA